MKNIREIEGNLTSKNKNTAASSLKGAQHQYGKHIITSQPNIEGGRRSNESSNIQL